MAIQTNDDIKKDDTKLEKVLDRKNREILILKEISAKVSSSLDLDITLNTLLSLLDDYFSYRYSMVLLTDAEGLLTWIFVKPQRQASSVNLALKI